MRISCRAGLTTIAIWRQESTTFRVLVCVCVCITRIHSLTHEYVLALLTFIHTHSHTPTHTLSRTPSHTHTLSHNLSHTISRMHSLTQAGIQSQYPSISPALSTTISTCVFAGVSQDALLRVTRIRTISQVCTPSTHTHACCPAYAYLCTHSLFLSHTQTRSHTYSHTIFPLAYAHIHTHLLSVALSREHWHARQQA
jgi:hypothetical protein